MTNKEIMKEQGYLSISEIIYLIMRALGANSDKFKKRPNSSNAMSTLKKPIERFFKDNGIKGKKLGNAYYFSKSDIYNLIMDEDAYQMLKINICGKLRDVGLKKDDNNNFEKIRAQVVELENNKNEIKKIYDELGLSNEDVKNILFSKISGGDLLDIDEMQYLNKNKDENSKYTGLVHRSDLTEDEKEILDLYNKAIMESEAEDREIERLFKEKKLEIKINYLFERYCNDVTIDEELLRTDISNAVRGGIYDSDVDTFRLYIVDDDAFNIDKSKIKDIDKFDVDIRESKLRLNNNCSNPYIIKVK